MPLDHGDPAPWRPPPPQETDLETLRKRVEDLERHVNWILGQAALWEISRDKDRGYG